MPTLPKTGPSLFLGIELATDQLRASIVDETLDLVGVESIDFDSELSEYQCVFLPNFRVVLIIDLFLLLTCAELKVEYSQLLAKHTPRPWRCGLKVLVSPMIFFFPLGYTEANPFSPINS